MDLSFNLAPSYRDLKDPTSRQNFEDTVEQKRVIDLIPCHTDYQNSMKDLTMGGHLLPLLAFRQMSSKMTQKSKRVLH